jgi:hypothetical protein
MGKREVVRVGGNAVCALKEQYPGESLPTISLIYGLTHPLVGTELGDKNRERNM